MKSLLRSAVSRRAACLLFGALTVLSLVSTNVCVADGSYMLTWVVPAPDEDNAKSSPGGWGALVITFDRAIDASTAFTFGPACMGLNAGMIDPASNGKTIQLGPGGYGLGKTGEPITQPPNSPFLGQPYGHFVVTVNYTGAIKPEVTNVFWQNKPAPSGNRTWTFNPNQDGITQVPEPSTFVLGACGLLALAVLRKRAKR